MLCGHVPEYSTCGDGLLIVQTSLSEASINVSVEMDELDLTSAETKATYKEIEEWGEEHYGFYVTNLNIAQAKQKYGIIERANCYCACGRLEE